MTHNFYTVWKLIKSILFLMFISVLFVNCNSYSDGNVFDNSSNITEPAEDPQSMLAKVVLSSYSRSVDSYIDEDQIQIGGDCFAGLYPENFIEYSMQNQATKDFEILSNNDLDTNTVRTDSFCDNGHFYIIVPTVRVANMVAGNIYRINIRIVSIDEDGVKVYSKRTETAIVTIRE